MHVGKNANHCIKQWHDKPVSFLTRVCNDAEFAKLEAGKCTLDDTMPEKMHHSPAKAKSLYLGVPAYKKMEEGKMDRADALEILKIYCNRYMEEQQWKELFKAIAKDEPPDGQLKTACTSDGSMHMLAGILGVHTDLRIPRMIKLPKPINSEYLLPRETLSVDDEVRDTDIVDDGYGPTPLTMPPFQFVGLTDGKMPSFMSSFPTKNLLRKAIIKHLEKCVDAAHPKEKKRIMEVLNTYSLIPHHIIRKLFLIQGALTWTMRRLLIVPRQQYPPTPDTEECDDTPGETSGGGHEERGGQRAAEHREPRARGSAREENPGEETQEDTPPQAQGEDDDEALQPDASGEYVIPDDIAPESDGLPLTQGSVESEDTVDTESSSDDDTKSNNENTTSGGTVSEERKQWPLAWTLTTYERVLTNAHSTFEEYSGANEECIPKAERGKYHYNYTICLSTHNKYCVPHYICIRWLHKFIEYAEEDGCWIGLFHKDGGKPEEVTSDTVPIIRNEWDKYLRVKETSKRGDGYYVEFAIRTNLIPHSNLQSDVGVSYDRFFAHAVFLSKHDIHERFSVCNNVMFTPIILAVNSNLSDGLSHMKDDLIARLKEEADITVDPRIIQMEWRHEKIGNDECWAACVLAPSSIDKVTVLAILHLPKACKTKYEHTWDYGYHEYHPTVSEDTRSNAIRSQAKYLRQRRYLS